MVAPEPQAAKACVYLVCPDGARTSLSYAGRDCAREGYLPLPTDMHDSLASWASHSKYTDVVASLDVYRVHARMATRDERSRHGNWGVHGLFMPWSEYKWAEFAEGAYEAACYGLGRKSALAQSLADSLVRLRFAKRKDERLEFRQRPLSAEGREKLLLLLATTEEALAGEERMRRVRRTIEDFARAAPAVFLDRPVPPLVPPGGRTSTRWLP